jgi:hypothetical protein
MRMVRDVNLIVRACKGIWTAESTSRASQAFKGETTLTCRLYEDNGVGRDFELGS